MKKLSSLGAWRSTMPRTVMLTPVVTTMSTLSNSLVGPKSTTPTSKNSTSSTAKVALGDHRQEGLPRSRTLLGIYLLALASALAFEHVMCMHLDLQLHWQLHLRLCICICICAFARAVGTTNKAPASCHSRAVSALRIM